MIKRKKYTIEHIDAFEWLMLRKPRTIHAVVTDPPYGVLEFSAEELVKKRSGIGGIWRLPIDYDGHKRNPMPRFTVLNELDHQRIRQFHGKLAPLLFKVLVPGGHVMIASQNLLSHLAIHAFCTNGFELRGQIARIVKTLRGGDRPKNAHKKYPSTCVSPRSCWEPWLIFRKPCEGRVKDNLKKWHSGALRRREIDRPFADLIPSNPARGIERIIAPHPSLKPQSFIRQLVWASLPLGRGTILDPFMGSGSTIAAAQYFGLRSIGLEMDKEYYELARRAIDKLTGLEPTGPNSTHTPTNKA